jgi:hypothetical protein
VTLAKNPIVAPEESPRKIIATERDQPRDVAQDLILLYRRFFNRRARQEPMILGSLN